MENRFIKRSLIPLDGSYSYCTTIYKGPAGRMILLGGPDPARFSTTLLNSRSTHLYLPPVWLFVRCDESGGKHTAGFGN